MIEPSSRVAAFGAEAGYPILIRGTADNRTIRKKPSCSKVLVTYRLLIVIEKKLVELFAHDAQFIISNVEESGYAIPAPDRNLKPKVGEVPKGFPTKLLALLIARHKAGGARSN